MAEETSDSLARSTRQETAFDIAAAVASLAPWIGGPVSVVLSGMSLTRKLERVREVLTQVAEDVRDLDAESSKKYVQTEEFEELLEKTLRQAADERNEEKRKIYAAFLTGNIRSPGAPYDEQVRILRTLEEIQPDHIRVLKALMQEPDPDPGMMGTISGTLQKRLSDIDSDRIKDLAGQLTDMRVVAMADLNTMMTGRGAEELRHTVTAYGRSLVRYLSS